MKIWWALALLFLTACGGPDGTRWPDPLSARYSAPLFEAHHPRALLLEGRLNGTRLLFALDLAATGTTVGAKQLQALGLMPNGDPRRGEPSTLATLDLGDLRLESVPVHATDHELGQIYGRAVDGVIGRDVFGNAQLDMDLGSGLLWILPGTPVVAARPNAPTVGRAVGDTQLELIVSTANWFGRLPARVAKAAALEVAAKSDDSPTAWRDPKRPELRFVRASGPPMLGFGALKAQSLRFDAAQGELALRPASAGARPSRFPELDRCGSLLRGCLKARIKRVQRGRVELTFEPSETALPEGFWVKLALQAPSASPQTVLVRVNKTAHPQRLVIERPALNPADLLAVDALVPIVDAVPLRAPCPAEACAR